MTPRPARFPYRRAGTGFTLIELLVAFAVLSMFLGAMVFAFENLGTRSALDEGSRRLETLLRFARAEAANRGRTIRLEFLPDAGPATSPPRHIVRLAQEKQPLRTPGVFTPLSEKDEAWTRQLVNELVRVEAVRLIAPAGWEPESGSAATAELPPVHFYPDGSSDAAEIVLVSSGGDDPRRAGLRLAGITGALTRFEPGPAHQEPAAGDGEERSPPW